MKKLLLALIILQSCSNPNEITIDNGDGLPLIIDTTIITQQEMNKNTQMNIEIQEARKQIREKYGYK